MRRHAPGIMGRDGARPSISQFTLTIVLALAIVDLTGCAGLSRHQFADPSRDWKMRSGQLLYRTAKTTIVGEVVVRFSENGEFELTFSKGPGVTLLILRQSDTFAAVKSGLARMGWSGAVEHAPKQLRGWLQLRDKIIHAQDHQPIRLVHGAETFILRF